MPTSAQIITDFLHAQQVDTLFGVPGESYLSVLDALYDSPINFINARHEGGAAFMAEAYAKLTHKIGVCFTTRGPGACNAAIGVHTAMQNSTPMLLFIGQVARTMRGREAFQEIDYTQFFAPIAKWVVEIDDPSRTSEILMRAYTTALSGRAGPVVVALPEDVLRGESPPLPVKLSTPLTIAKPAPNPQDLFEAKRILSAAKRPLLLVGGGGWTDAGRAGLRDFIATANLPVVCNLRRQDLIDMSGAHYAGDLSFGKTPQIRRLFDRSDVIFAVNTRFGEVSTEGWSLLPVPDTGKTLIHSHNDAGELHKIYHADLAINACPNLLIQGLAGEITGDWQGWLGEAQAGYATQSATPDSAGAVNPAQICAHLNEVLDKDAIITTGAGNFAIWPSKYINYGGGRRLIAPQSGAMGAGLPAAIAARIACPNRQVICFAGDGDFQMSVAEMGCAAQENARPCVLIFNNGSYGTIKMHQARDYPGRECGTALDNPDFEAIAGAYGFGYHRVESVADFIAGFDAGLDAGGVNGQVFELILDKRDISPNKILEG